MEYEDVGASGELTFVVKPYDREALRARAGELFHSATTGDEYGFGYSALATLDPAVAEPFLCDLMKLDRPSAPVQRLAQIGSDASVQCLINSLPVVKGLDHDILIGALTRLLSDLPDGEIKEKVRVALQQKPR